MVPAHQFIPNARFFIVGSIHLNQFYRLKLAQGSFYLGRRFRAAFLVLP
jgi:hypothetical protein